MHDDRDVRETPLLVINTLRQVTRLMQGEFALAKAELSRNLSRAGSGLALIAIGALLALTALDVLAGAAVGYLAAQGIGLGTAAQIVGGIMLIAAGGLAMVGRSRLSAKALSPDRAVRNLSRDIAAIKEASRGT